MIGLNCFRVIKSTAYLMLIACFIYSCSKEKDNNTNLASGPVIYPDYGQLKVGNYWVYEIFSDNGTGMLTSLNIFDSSYIEKDTLIDSIKYFKKIRSFLPDNTIAIEYLRNYQNYILSYSSNLFYLATRFSSKTPNDTLLNHVCVTDTSGNPFECHYAFMTDRDSIFNLPVGTFKTFSLYEKGVHYPLCLCPDSSDIMNTRYAKDYGIVLESYEVILRVPLLKVLYEKRLIRYHVVH